MKNLKINELVKTVQSVLAKRSPEILTGIGIAGMITSTVLAVKATPKALSLIEDEKQAQNEHISDDARSNNTRIIHLKLIEVVKVTWKCYIPTVLTGIASTACLIGASSVNFKRNAALATAYQLSATALTEYKEKVSEVIGERKERDIRDRIAKDKINNDPVGKHEVIVTGNGDTLCYDAYGGRYFKSSIDKIKKAENELNRVMLKDMYVSLNEFYDELGLKHTKLGDDLGWNLDDGFINIEFSSQLSEDGTPCIVINYTVSPNYNYSSFG
jgi:hypothetical protein